MTIPLSAAATDQCQAIFPKGVDPMSVIRSRRIAALAFAAALASSSGYVLAQAKTPQQIQQLAWQLRNTPPQFQGQAMETLKTQLSAQDFQAVLQEVQNPQPGYSNPMAEQAIQQIQAQQAGKMQKPSFFSALKNKLTGNSDMLMKAQQKQAFRAQIAQQALMQGVPNPAMDPTAQAGEEKPAAEAAKPKKPSKPAKK